MPKMKILNRNGCDNMSRPAKAIDTNSMKMSKEERKQREETEKNLRGANDKIRVQKFLTKRQKQIFKYMLQNLNKDILSNLDVYLLNQTAITIERLESIEKKINENSSDGLDVQTAVNLKSLRDMYSKDFFRCCNELSLSPQARAKLSISAPPPKKKTLMDILGEEESEDE